MAKKRKPAYFKVLDGMNCCYGSEERHCGDCPFDRYNDRDFYGQGTALCMEKLNEAAKKWTESLTMFTTCGECICFHRNQDENGEWRYTDEDTTDGLCSVWQVMMMETEFCSRGAPKD